MLPHFPGNCNADSSPPAQKSPPVPPLSPLDYASEICYHEYHAGMVEQVDTRDLKSLAVKSVPVRFRSAAPKSLICLLTNQAF